ncbi:MAG: nitrilase-related carbon-nitrogen hydrolase [Thermoanaerobaculia bacterium]
MSLLPIALAQLDARLGDLAGNLERHLETIERARMAGARLVVFPELSLTGYRLLHLTPHVARAARDSPELATLVEAAGDMTVLAGLVESGADGVLYNSAALLTRDGVQAVQRKIHLPTYGIFQEGRFFAPGRRLEPVEIAGVPAGIVICEDLWHPQISRRLARGGAQVLLVTSAGPGRVSGDAVPDSQQSWELLTRSTAMLNGCWVLYCNRVGFEEGSFYTGGSHVVAPDGEIVARAPLLDEHLLIAEIDLAAVGRARRRMPLLTTERLDVEGPR